MVIGKILRIPVVHTQYCEVTVRGDGLRELLRCSIVSYCSRFQGKFCGISANVCSSLIKAGIPAKKVEFIVPAVPIQSLNGHLQNKSLPTFSETDFVALFIGNLKINKGIDILLDAFVALAPEFPNLQLLITTELKHENFSERKGSIEKKLSQYGLVDRVVWLGFVDDIIGLIREVDVVVVPFLNLKGISDYPLVVLEAMSVGTPVIATDVGGTSEILSNDSGILIPPDNIDALCNAFKRIMTKKLNKMNRSTSLRFECFDPVIVGQKYRAIFRDKVV